MKRTISSRGSLTRKATAAMQDAVDKLIEDHRRRHMPLAVWQDGKVVRIPPERASVVREDRAIYRTRPRGRKP